MSSNITEWKSFIDETILINNKEQCLRVPVKEHPLKNVVVTERFPRRLSGSSPATKPGAIMEPFALTMEVLDPLTEFSLKEQLDPLSQLALQEKPLQEKPGSSKNTNVNLQSWSSKKQSILSKFTTSEKISFVTSFLSEGEKVVVKAQSTVVDKVQHRLDQLDYFEEGSQRKMTLSQSEYVGQIEQLNKELVTAWHSEQRVKSLKIAIQCAKLLADTDVLAFYPSKFVLVTDILDIFGQLVYERLRTKTDYYKPGSQKPSPLPEDFTAEMVPETAKETCLNWFFKIASIRELVPRLYVELALIKSYNFLSSNAYSEALTRITQMCYGIGNPLVSIYLRCYLCRMGLLVGTNSSNNKYLQDNYTAFLDTYHHLFSRTVKADLQEQKLTLSAYMSLYTPALDYILEAVAYHANDSILSDLLDRCQKHGNSSLILNTIMASFKPAYISSRSLQFLEMMAQCTDDGISLYVLLRGLGLCVTVCPPPAEQRRQVLAVVWKHISSLTQPIEYISAAEAWVQYVVQYFSNREINTILGDIIDHITPNRVYENHYNELKIIVNTVVSNSQDFELLLIMDNFLPLVDLFQQESTRIEVCKRILSLSKGSHITSDPIVTNALMFLCTMLHDSVNALTPEDEYRQIGEILCGIVRRVNFRRDFEQQMAFYVEARGAFSNIEVVLAQLVQCVNWLSVSTRQIIRGLHSQKTADFVRACAAYCFITIPSINSVKSRLKLYLLSGQVALFNQCLGQADACFKAALSIIPELDLSEDKSNEGFLLDYVRQFLSILLVVPDNPEKGVLNLTKALLNVVRSFVWSQSTSLATIYICVIDLLSAMSQQQFPYYIERVESNDALYGSNEKFLEELNNICTVIMGELLNILKSLGNCKKQYQVALELFVRVANRGDLTIASLPLLAVNLWQLCLKNGYGDVKYMLKTREYFKKKAYNTNNLPLQKLVERLVLPG